MNSFSNNHCIQFESQSTFENGFTKMLYGPQNFNFTKANSALRSYKCPIQVKREKENEKVTVRSVLLLLRYYFVLLSIAIVCLMVRLCIYRLSKLTIRPS